MVWFYEYKMQPPRKTQCISKWKGEKKREQGTTFPHVFSNLSSKIQPTSYFSTKHLCVNESTIASQYSEN